MLFGNNNNNYERGSGNSNLSFPLINLDMFVETSSLMNETITTMLSR